MSDIMKPQLEVVRERMQRATPGPWGWFGNTKANHVYLATQRWGRHLVMDFARWGMQAAQPVFFGREDPAAISEGRVSNGTYQPAAKVPVFEVARDALSADDGRVYRTDLVGLRNADAAFIANSRADVEWLVGEVDRLQGIVDAGTAKAADGTTLRLIGWTCEHRWNTDADGKHLGWDHRKGKLVKQTNVSGSTYTLGQWGHDEPERRCPYAKPVFSIVEPDAVSA
ncbi:hypothetical protein [Agromyces aureus]|uniref:Uncharacterized protein n=1 Tax=Agromyces aureus TaxID=453304 RepID=A0A191WEU9_9MICO|nr:hypothetical protein [Agromyces aureus]ANJ26786.1 hypothetical protein ATC03_08735 [Agromyces aureus]